MTTILRDEDLPILTQFKTVEFGRYPQGGEVRPIRWLVLEERPDGISLLLSLDCLENRAYHKAFGGVTWADCDLRAWLNGDFVTAAFTQEERSRIRVQHLTNPDNPAWGAPGGPDTDDEVFLLSLGEVETFLGVKVFERDMKLLARDAHGEGCVWWLRSPGVIADYAAEVDTLGCVGVYGSNVFFDDNFVRSACCVSLRS